MRIARLLLALTSLSVLAYLPVFWQPFIADDYQQIDMGRSWGPVSGWAQLAQEPLFRSRATSVVFTHWTERLFGMSPRVFYTSSVILHVLNVWMIFGLGFWKRIGWTLSFATASFFAVYLGHQEAVMWYAAVHELLMFFFALCFVMAWIRWSQTGKWLYYSLALISFVLALYSKEPAVVLVPVGLLITWWECGKSERPALWVRLGGTVPLGLIALVYTAAIFSAAPSHQHFNDGTFSIHAPFWLTWRNSFGRLLWVWGLLSLIWLFASGEWARYRGILLAAGIWVSITLLPFSFLTYMHRIPSRHTYFPSLGLALLVGTAVVSFRSRMYPRNRLLTTALAITICTHQCLYLWIVKRPQYLARAQATETLLRLVREGRTPVRIHCFPYYSGIPDLALQITLNADPRTLLVWDEGFPHTGCPSGRLSSDVTPPGLVELR